VVGYADPGPLNAITDVAGVRVGHTTLIEGDGPLVVGHGPIRTGVTVIMPSETIWDRPLFAGTHTLNGNGELTGLEWVRESGTLTTPIGLTNTHSVGAVRDALVAIYTQSRDPTSLMWSLPVVGETWDGVLNDINGQHVRPAHVESALASATSGPVAEGGVGGGTGMICHQFKGGIGTASRRLSDDQGGFTVGALVQANHGRRLRLAINGVPVGRLIGVDDPPTPRAPDALPPGAGSIIAVIATDAPLLPHQCTRLAQRAGLGIARTGGVGEHSSGDIFIAFATGNDNLPSDGDGTRGTGLASLVMLPNHEMTPLFDAVVEATEEAIVNALFAAETMVGRDGIIAHALDGERVADLLQAAG
jgi:D-aminopeptidase